MVIMAVTSLVLGVLCGHALFPPEWVAVSGHVVDYALYILMFSVGISVGGNKGAFYKMKEYHIKILIIPAAIMVASVLGGFVCAWITGIPTKVSVPITSAMGWYSLAGIMLTGMAGVQAGTLAFLSSLMREMLSFLMIPPIAKHLNHYTVIAPAASSSEDTSLPMIIRYTSEEVVVMAVCNGVITSAMVPVLIRVFFHIL